MTLIASNVGFLIGGDKLAERGRMIKDETRPVECPSSLSQRLDWMIDCLEYEAGIEDGAGSRFYTWRMPSGAFPYCHYLEPMDQFWHLCRGLDLVHEDRDYLQWLPPYAEAPYSWIETADVATLGRFLFAIHRQERFLEGLSASMVTGGVFLRILRQVRDLRGLSLKQ